MSADPEKKEETQGASHAALRFLDSLTGITTGLLLYIACIFMFIMVITRYVFSFSDPSVEIIARYMMIWAAFIGVSTAVQTDSNIRFTLVEQILPPAAKRIFKTLGCVVGAAISLAIMYSGIVLVEETMMFNEVMPTALRWPIWIFHLSIAVGGGLLTLQSIRSAGNIFRGIAPDTAAPHP
ncbi:MAG: TRAP transporter small permease [Rhodospirillaceae bacterium]|jgi:C4-dicarboxylate transporter, DctQ subunit|nr:TRAP transporter small permease [Rhodospirillaceae bacterium]